jgi:hypothetical protein
MARYRYRFALLNQIEQSRQLRLRLLNVHQHDFQLIPF